MKNPLFSAALLFASVSLFGAAAGGGTVPTVPSTPGTTTPPTVKPPCSKPSPAAPKAPAKKEVEKREVEKKCDDSKRPFKS